jgi:uncharacterized membrane protein YfcA
LPHSDTIALFVAALIGQALNAVAGGGSFVTFPSLLLAGVSPIEANATSTIALWPGALSSAWGYRRDLAADRNTLITLGAVSIVGGLAGALLLLATPERRFAAMIPYLLGFATVLFAGSDSIGETIRRRFAGGSTSRRLAFVAVIQLAVAIYGGYFGGGIGIMMLAAFALMDLGNIHAMNGLKAILGAVINGAAVVTFAVGGLVVWKFALPMVVASIISGYVSAKIARRVEPKKIRWLVIVVGAAMTVYFFIRR